MQMTDEQELPKEPQESSLEEQISNKIKEEREHNKKISSFIRKRAQREPKQSIEFIMFINEAEKQLQEGKDLLLRAEHDPKLIFIESRNVLSKRKIMQVLMNSWSKEGEPVKGHDYQVYLAYLADRYFQDWLREKGIQEKFRMEVRNANQFPSVFAVYHKEIELVQFNLLEMWYGIRSYPKTQEEMDQHHTAHLASLEREIKNREEDLEVAILRREQPLKYYKGLRNYLAYLFLDKKKLYQGLDKLIKNKRYLLADAMEQKERAIQYHPDHLAENKVKREWIDTVVPFFLELGYYLETTESRLY